MSTYAELTQRLQDTIENAFSDTQLAAFFRMAEEKIYQAAQPPVLRSNQVGNLSAGVPYLSLPNGFLYVFSLAVIDGTGRHEYLIEKDPSFLREAYPSPAYQAAPRYYGIYDENTLIVGPTPDLPYQVELNFASYPESVVTAGETWLSKNFGQVLFNGAMVEAARFIKADQEMLALYDKLYAESLGGYKMWVDGKLRQDVNRAGQTRVPVM